MKVKVIVHQRVIYKGSRHLYGDEFEVEGIACEQLIRSGTVAPVDEPAPVVEAPVAPEEPSQDLPKKKGKALRSFQSK